MGKFFKLVFDIGYWLEGEKNEICTIHNQTYLVKHGRWRFINCLWGSRNGPIGPVVLYCR